MRIVEHGLKHLETKNYKKLAKDLGMTSNRCSRPPGRSRRSNRGPGRTFATTRVEYVVPDVFVVKEGDDYVVRLNEDGCARSCGFRATTRTCSRTTARTGKEAKGYIQERMQAALWLIKSIHQRQQTLYKVAYSIVKFQRDFLDNGDHPAAPADPQGCGRGHRMHESTVSRVTTNKYMHSPQGTYELKFFFSSAIQSRDGDDLASRSVKARIREIVARENGQEPLSDLKIAGILSKEFGLKIARRTVSKYRETSGNPALFRAATVLLSPASSSPGSN